MDRAVKVGLDRHAVVIDPIEVAQRVDLESAAVGEDRPFPPHKPVQAALAGDKAGTGAEMKVVGVAEKNPRPGFRDIARHGSLDARRRTDGHERGRLKGVAAHGHPASPRGAPFVPGGNGKFERSAHGLIRPFSSSSAISRISLPW